jgi:protein-S-isoprenylcysteine O-methyltransferase Ste14
VTLTGLGILAAAILLAVFLDLNPIKGALFVMAAYAAAIIAIEVGVEKVHLRPSTGIDWAAGAARAFAWQRVGVKYLGLVVSILGVVGAHWLLRFYPIADMKIAGSAALLLAPPVLILAAPYIAYVDRGMVQPRDGYWQAGMLALGRLDEVDWRALREHALGWMIKGFFLPIMFVYLVKNVVRLQSGDLSFGDGLVPTIQWLTAFVITIELAVVSVGYLCTLRAVDAHIRSPNPFLAGWLVTLVCYEPFNHVIGGQVLRYNTGLYWYDWFGEVPLLAVPWAVAILASFATWVWATACFGVRWSNLTNRGIITNGPYRFTKHPDYVSKSIFFWLVNVPFLSAGGPVVAIQTSLLLVGINLVYFARARTEERHLSEDPTYVAYALAMNERSIFRWVARIVPGLRYRAPVGRDTAVAELPR